MNFKTYREALKMTQEDISAMLGIPRRTWQNWEGEVNKPPRYVEAMIEKQLSGLVIAAMARAGAVEGKAAMKHGGIDYSREGEEITLSYEGITYKFKKSCKNGLTDVSTRYIL